MAKKKQKKYKLECDSCEMKFSVSFSGKGVIECCPFCGEPITATQDELPLLNDFDSLDEFDDDRHFADDEDDIEDDE